MPQLAKFSLLLLPFLAGCVKETQNGQSFTYAYDWWVSYAWFGGALIAIGSPILFRRSPMALRLWLAGIPAFLGFSLAGLSSFHDKVVVNDIGVTRAIWPNTSKKRDSFQWNELKDVHLEGSELRTNRGERIRSIFFVFTLKDGDNYKINSACELFDKAIPRVIEQLDARGFLDEKATQAVEDAG